MNSETTTAEALLGMLSLQPMSGYELRKLIAESIGNFWTESYGQIYPALKRLEAANLVRSGKGERAGSKVYSLTEDGWTRLLEWLDVPPRRQVPRNDLLLKLFFGHLAAPGTMRQAVQDRRRELQVDLARYDGIQARLEGLHKGNPGLPFWLITVRYGQAEARALLQWCDETLAALQTVAALAGSQREPSPQETFDLAAEQYQEAT